MQPLPSRQAVGLDRREPREALWYPRAGVAGHADDRADLVVLKARGEHVGRAVAERVRQQEHGPHVRLPAVVRGLWIGDGERAGVGLADLHVHAVFQVVGFELGIGTSCPRR